MILNNFRLDDQGRIIPVGNLKGAITTGGLVPGVPIWTGEASGVVATFPDGGDNKPIAILTDEQATKLHKRGKNLIIVNSENEKRSNGNPPKSYANNNTCSINVTVVGAYWIIWEAFEITSNLLGQNVTLSYNITGGTCRFCWAEDWTGSITDTPNATKEITADMIGKKLGVRFVNTSGSPQTVDHIQIEFGSTPTQYEDYRAEDYNAPFLHVESFFGYNTIWADYGSIYLKCKNLNF